MIDPGLRNRTVLITGANNPYGIGAATALAFAKVGAQLFLHFHHEPADEVAFTTGPGETFYRAQQAKSCEEVIAKIAAEGGNVDAFEADFTDPTSAAKLFDAAERTFGQVDVLVNNAATWVADTLLPQTAPTRNRLLNLWAQTTDFSTAVFTRHMTVNAGVPALLMQEFARRHYARGARWGRVINISTDGAECFPSEVSYGASKLALEGLSRSAAGELGQFGITVNALALGPVQTGWITRELENALVPSQPLGRIGTPQDVADVIVFFASDQARWITGQRLFVGGGHRM